MRTLNLATVLLALTASAPVFAGAASRGELLKVAAHSATASVGRITAMEGSVLLGHSDAVIPAQRGTTLGPGDSILTASNGTAQWWMEDDTVFASVPGSMVGVDQFDHGARTAQYSLKHGGMRSVTGLIHHSLVTPKGDVQVEGADYAAFICEEGCGAEKGVFVRVSAGKAVVSNAGGTLTLGPGQIALLTTHHSAPRLVLKAPSAFLAILAQLQLTFASFGVEVEIDVDPPLIEVEPPISPS